MTKEFLAIFCNAVQYSTVQYSTVQHNTVNLTINNSCFLQLTNFP